MPYQEEERIEGTRSLSQSMSQMVIGVPDDVL